MYKRQRVGKQIAFLAAFAVLGYGFRRLMIRLGERDRWYVALIWLAACAFGADWAGLHFMVGAFPNRRALLDVPRLGPKAFEQCAGFLRIRGGDDPLSLIHI